MRHKALSAIVAGLVLVGSACSTDAPPIGESIDLSAFSEAWSSGDPDLVRDFYTEDAIIFPIGVDETKGDSVAGGWATGADIDREVAQHSGGTYEIFDAVRVGDIATYTWRWDLGHLIITGADILHFHDDLIWRLAATSTERDDAARRQVTVLRYQVVDDGASEVLERPWVLHWHTQAGFADLARKAGLRVVTILAADGTTAPPAATEFGFILRRSDAP